MNEGSTESAGLLAEFSGQSQLLQAVRTLRDRGYTKLDAFSPFPIHGMDDALGVKPTPLAWYALIAGVIGGCGALAFQWWTNAVDYPYLISGKPLFSLPANIPVTFEVIILAAAFATFFGMLMLNGLPRLSNPLHRSDRFRAATNDGFFVFVTDSNGDEKALRDALQSLRPQHVESIAAIPDEKIPTGLKLTAIVLGAIALLPPLAIASVRGTTSPNRAGDLAS